jgi:hypothetical protein
MGLAVTDERIDGNVHPDHQEAQGYLDGRRESPRVEHRKNVVLDEPAWIANLSGLSPQRLFPEGQGADPTGELDERSPYRCRKMDPAEGWPPEDEESPCHHEDDEGEVDDNETVGQDSVEHNNDQLWRASRNW